MILRKMRWLVLLFLQLSVIQAQNARSYDTSDWIPISPTSQEEMQVKKASGRILNLDVLKQRFLHDDEYITKIHPQYFNENPQKPQYYIQEDQESVVPPRQQQQHHLNFYHSENKSLPALNTTLYNPGLINREILGAIENNQNLPLSITPAKLKDQNKESIQLVYIPLENLKQQNPETTQQETGKQEVADDRFQSKHEINRVHNHHKQNQLYGIEQDFLRQTLEAHKLQQQIQLGRPILFQTTSTSKTTKKKPHQPPLAVYMESNKKAQVIEVLDVLKEAKTISVQDNVGPNSPPIFIGPSNLTPQGYTKFPLPYLSNVASNRIEHKVDSLPFFVAPLSYRAPDGYSKIPLPAPHIGSVVVSIKDKSNTSKQNHIHHFQLHQEQDDDDAVNVSNIQEYTKEPIRQTNKFSSISLDVNNYDGKMLQTRIPPINQNQFIQDNFANLFISQQSSSISPPSTIGDQLKQTQPDFTDLFALQEPSQVAESSQNQQDTTVKSQTKPVQHFNLIQKPDTSQNLEFISSQFTTRQKPTLNYNYNRNVPFRQALSDLSHTNQAPLKQAINNFQVQKTYSFGEENTTIPNDSQHSLNVNTEKTLLSFDKITTESTKSKKRQRIKSTTTSLPLHNYDSSKFTVLEEFPIKPKATTVKYTTEIETIPAIVYKLNTEEQAQGHVLNQQTLYGPSTESFLTKTSSSSLVYENEPSRQQFLPGLINNLQDKSIPDQLNKKLLAPNVLFPTTEKVVSNMQQIVKNTPPATDYPYHIETTTTQQLKRTRGRQRVTNYSVTTPSALRRTVSRRRPTANKIKATELFDDQVTTKRHQNQRVRIRGRPTQTKIDNNALINDRIYQTTSTELITNPKQAGFDRNYQSTNSADEPQSYMKFEHVIDDQQVLTIKPNVEQVSSEQYHAEQIYLQPSTTKLPVGHESEQKPVVNVQITHPFLENRQQQTKNPYVRFSDNGGVLHNENIITTTTKKPIKIRSRTRGRFRFTTTTEKSTTDSTETKDEYVGMEKEFYGFIRQPNFNKPKLQSIIYQTTTDVPQSTSIHFIGEIRPKYESTIGTTTRVVELQDIKTVNPIPRIKNRGRIRQHGNNQKQSNAFNQQKSKNFEIRQRGKANFNASENYRKPIQDEYNEKYPSTYYQHKIETTIKPASFQITVNPHEDDQQPYSSINHLKIVANPNNNQWVKPTDVPNFNQVEIEDKKLVIADSVEDATPTKENERTTVKKSRRRGVWKLVKKHKPIDNFETAESQNYKSVLNSFGEIQKVSPVPTKNFLSMSLHASTTNQTIVEQEDKTTLLENDNLTTTTTPTFPEEMTENVNTDSPTTNLPTTSSTPIVKKYQVEPWNMKAIKTLTSTEISHETEICYKGRCVRSKKNI